MDNENTINNDIKYDFKSTVVMEEKDYLEIGRTNYFVFSLISVVEFFILLAFSIMEIITNFRTNDNSITHIILTGLVVLFMAIMFFKTHYAQKKNFRRALFLSGEQNISQTIYFGDKIISKEKNGTLEFDYSNITAIKETEKYYLLKMQYNMHMIVEKDIKSNLNNVNFIDYILSKATNLTTKTVQKEKNYKLIAFVFMCLTALLLIVDLAFVVIGIISFFASVKEALIKSFVHIAPSDFSSVCSNNSSAY